jgi:hypothetical protein
MSFESQVSTTETSFTESTTIKSASLDLASLRTLEEIKAAFSDLSKEEVGHILFLICYVESLIFKLLISLLL